jgi:2-oxoglutarate ferredoxin oxidoreductase subunit beta
MHCVFTHTQTLTDTPTHYCPGCGHGVIHRLIAEVIDELDIRSKTIGIAPVGCAVLAYFYLDVDMVEVAHGRAPAVATGIKRVRPETIVFSYQGDGDLASIGTAEIVHAAHRAEKITVIFVNNAVYGMTCGQMAPTTMINQVTSTTPHGRNPASEGYPMQVSEMLAVLPGARYIERCSVNTPAQVIKAKKAIKHAFQLQCDDEPGLSLVEVLSACPTYWRMSPPQAAEWIENEMPKVFPLSRIKG